jgi:hypothetical protein
MTPKDKAENLLNKYWKSCYDKHDFAKLNKEDAKQCALIAVDEIIKDKKMFNQISVEYWEDVKQEIEKL